VDARQLALTNTRCYYAVAGGILGDEVHFVDFKEQEETPDLYEAQVLQICLAGTLAHPVRLPHLLTKDQQLLAAHAGHGTISGALHPAVQVVCCQLTHAHVLTATPA